MVLGSGITRLALIPKFLPRISHHPLLDLPFAAVTQNYPNQISNLDPAPRAKVFVIGLSRTGTTSLGDALELLSYRRTGWEGIRSRLLFRDYIGGDLSFLIGRAFDFDAFEDLPWSLVYREMACLYPDAKFILTLRKSEDAWLQSIKRHTKSRKWDGHEVIYGVEEATDREGEYLVAYRNHVESVKEFFRSSGQEGRLLEFVIDQPKISKGEKWSRLCEFLDVSDSMTMLVRQVEFPWSNPTLRSKVSSNLQQIMAKTKLVVEEGIIICCTGWAG